MSRLAAAHAALPANDDELMGVAERVCTEKQREALRLYARGYGRVRAARILRISPQAFGQRLDGARRALRQELGG